MSNYQRNFETNPIDYCDTGSDVPTKLTLTEREVNALINYMDAVFEHQGIDEFVKDMGPEDDECWDIMSTKSVYKKLLNASNAYYRVESKVTITDDNYGDKVDTLVGNMVASNDKEFTHDSEGC